MPRPLRVEYEGARYHVMARGNRDTKVFGSDDDVRLWLKTLGEAAQRSEWRVHAYVLMISHYHLLLETPQGNLVDGMKWFQGAFTQRMNAMHKTWGHLFQGRYKAKIIDMDDPVYFRKVSEYIHLNPAAAGALGRRQPVELESYPWSSYGFYISRRHRASWLTVTSVLGHYGLKDTRSGREKYREMMQSQAVWAARCHKNFQKNEHYGQMDRGWVHGGKEFRNEMKEVLSGQASHPIYDSEQRRDLSVHGAWKKIVQGADVLGFDPDQLPKMRKSAPEKLMLAAYIKEHYSLPNAQISQLLHMGHRSLVGRSQTEIMKTKMSTNRYVHLKRLLNAC